MDGISEKARRMATRRQELEALIGMPYGRPDLKARYMGLPDGEGREEAVDRLLEYVDRYVKIRLEYGAGEIRVNDAV